MFSFAQNEILYTREREGLPRIELIFVRVPCVSVVSDTSCELISSILQVPAQYLWTSHYVVFSHRINAEAEYGAGRCAYFSGCVEGLLPSI